MRATSAGFRTGEDLAGASLISGRPCRCRAGRSQDDPVDHRVLDHGDNHVPALVADREVGKQLGVCQLLQRLVAQRRGIGLALADGDVGQDRLRFETLGARHGDRLDDVGLRLSRLPRPRFGTVRPVGSAACPCPAPSPHRPVRMVPVRRASAKVFCSAKLATHLCAVHFGRCPVHKFPVRPVHRKLGIGTGGECAANARCTPCFQGVRTDPDPPSYRRPACHRRVSSPEQ